MTASTAHALAEWAATYEPTHADRELAQRALVDTIAVSLAARPDPIVPIAAELPPAARWAAVGHVLDFDDLHMESTSHISVVCVPATLAAGGGEQAYLAGAGVMARLGTGLGWRHYASGWHVTCTAGAPAAAVAASVSMGLSVAETAVAITLAIPAAGGVVRAFGTSAKSLQVGFAAEAGVRAAVLAAAGATADTSALDDWLDLVSPEGGPIDLSGPAIPGGLAVKLYPCCYACQRPIDAVRSQIPAGIPSDAVRSIRIATPAASVQPLIHHRPSTGLEAKFSIEYAVAAALIDDRPGFSSFSDHAVRRPEVQRLVGLVATETSPSGAGLLDGEFEIAITVATGEIYEARLTLPLGSPQRPPSADDIVAKLADCGSDVPELLAGITWDGARVLMRSEFPGR